MHGSIGENFGFLEEYSPLRVLTVHDAIPSALYSVLALTKNK